jgi:hypothetical protein
LEVAVLFGARKQRADRRHDAVHVKARQRAEQASAWLRQLEDRDATTGFGDARHLA